MTHVAPERWADWAQGNLAASEGTRAEEHAAGCARCDGQRRRVLAALAAVREVAAAPAPELGWDLARVRLHWATSMDLRRRSRAPSSWLKRGRWLFAAGLAFAGGALALSLALGARGRPPVVPAPPAAALPAQASPAPAAPAAPLEGVVTLLAGEASLDGHPLDLTAAIRPGARLATGQGRLAVQFGDHSGFVLEAGSSLELFVFDERTVILRVSGAVTVEVPERRPGQRFAVVAGSRAVEVRGTIFRVASRDDDLDVSVARGRVAVIQGEDTVEVPAGARLAVAAGLAVAGLQPTASDESAALRVPVVAGWQGAGELRGRTAVLALAARTGEDVRVDGVPVGEGALSLRAAPGRHLVEAGAASRWVEVEAGQTASPSLADAARSERPAQLDAQLEAHRAHLVGCGERARKLDPSFGGVMEVEIGVTTDGAVSFVSPVRGLADREVEDCVLSVLREELTFPVGTAATVQKKIRY